MWVGVGVWGLLSEEYVPQAPSWLVRRDLVIWGRTGRL